MKTFTVGNLGDYSLLEMYEKMFARTHWRFINTFGPKALYDAVAVARPDLPRKPAYTSICEVCVSATAGLDARARLTISPMPKWRFAARWRRWASRSTASGPDASSAPTRDPDAGP